MRKKLIISLAAILIILGCYRMCKIRLLHQNLIHEMQTRTNKYGFINVTFNITGQNGVVVIAPVNCLSERAKKAENLAEQLRSKNILVNLANEFNFRAELLPDTKPKKIEKIFQMIKYVIKKPAPIVSVNGKLKSNPTIEDILNELEG